MNGERRRVRLDPTGKIHDQFFDGMLMIEQDMERQGREATEQEVAAPSEIQNTLEKEN